MKATLLRDRNYDYVRQQTDSDARINAVPLPPSLYHASRPTWWGDAPWPPIGPDVPGMVNKLPAQIRYEAFVATGVPGSSVPPAADGQPAGAILLQNYPNPFNPVTTIRYVLPERSRVRLSVSNLLGQTVSTLVQEVQQAGSHDVQFDGSGLASGVYYVRILAGGGTGMRQMILLR